MTGPDPDRRRYAQIAGTAARHAQAWLTAEQEAAAAAELAEAAAGRADLLAECAGTSLGFGEGKPDAARYRQMAQLCIAAGADETLIGNWVTVGRARAATAATVPHSGHRASE
jgi:NAD(P)-dependent dehydrogenase (short-subunit alcohol dehydrogenase family)